MCVSNLLYFRWWTTNCIDPLLLDADTCFNWWSLFPDWVNILISAAVITIHRMRRTVTGSALQSSIPAAMRDALFATLRHNNTSWSFRGYKSLLHAIDMDASFLSTSPQNRVTFICFRNNNILYYWLLPSPKHLPPIMDKLFELSSNIISSEYEPQKIYGIVLNRTLNIM